MGNDALNDSTIENGEDQKVRFQPLSQRSNPSSDWPGPHDGVPQWLAQPLVDWVTECITDVDIRGKAFLNREALLQMQRELQEPLDWSFGDTGAAGSLFDLCTSNREFFLDVVDWSLQRRSALHGDAAMRLNRILAEGGSVWGVAESPLPHLERRVDPIVRALVETASSPASKAYAHLSASWGHVYGREGSSSEGYREAVRAVECAMRPVVAPANTKATLGTMIRDLELKPAKWKAVLDSASGGAILQVTAMARLVWSSQFDRHGDPDVEVPLSVSPAQAEAALHLAAALVHLFSHGVVTVAASSEE